MDQHQGFYRFQLVRKGGQEGQEFAIDQEHVGPGVVQGVQQLILGEAHIHRLQHRPHHGHGEKAFQIAVAVPVHDSHRFARFHPQPGQAVGQSADALFQIPVGVTHLVPIDDFLIRMLGQGRVEQVLDEQGKGIGGRRGGDKLDRHVVV